MMITEKLQKNHSDFGRKVVEEIRSDWTMSDEAKRQVWTTRDGFAYDGQRSPA
jgi:hypothetical protein